MVNFFENVFYKEIHNFLIWNCSYCVSAQDFKDIMKSYDDLDKTTGMFKAPKNAILFF
jgi:hypothetical protein